MCVCVCVCVCVFVCLCVSAEKKSLPVALFAGALVGPVSVSFPQASVPLPPQTSRGEESTSLPLSPSLSLSLPFCYMYSFYLSRSSSHCVGSNLRMCQSMQSRRNIFKHRGGISILAQYYHHVTTLIIQSLLSVYCMSLSLPLNVPCGVL